MSTVLYLFISNDSDNNTVSWVIDDLSGDLKQSQGSLKDAASAADTHSVTVILHGEKILYLTAQVPGKNKQKIQQAIPYVLEDNVIEDVDDLHFAISDNQTISDGHYQVAVINKEYIESIITELQNAEIQADIITADYLLLDKENILFIDNDRVLFSGANNDFSLKFATDIENIIDMGNTLLPADEKIKLVLCGKSESNEASGSKLESVIEEYSFEKEYCDGQPQACLIRYSSTNNVINFLQGRYKKKKNWSETTQKWLPVAAIFLIWLSVQSGLFIMDYFNLSQENKKLTTEINALYKKTFPKSRLTGDVKGQMASKLKILKNRKGQSGRSFTEMIAGSASIFRKTKKLKIKSLRYYDGRLNLELQLSDLQALDKLKNQLSKERGYRVEIQNASSNNEYVTARLQITGAAL